MSWPKFYFKLVAVIFIGLGVVAAVAPDQYISLLGVDPSVGGRLWGRAFGAASLGLGVVFWLIDPVAERRERRIAAIGAVLAFGFTALTDVVSVVGGDLPAYGWGFVAFNVVMVLLAAMLLRGGSVSAARDDR
jgi:hypothetical protein